MGMKKEANKNKEQIYVGLCWSPASNRAEKKLSISLFVRGTDFKYLTIYQHFPSSVAESILQEKE